jgi:hypothetical protein
VGPRAGLDVRKISPPPTGIRSPDRSARSQSLYHLSYPALKRCSLLAPTMVHAVISQPLTLQSQYSPCVICGVLSGSWTGVYPVLRLFLVIIVPQITHTRL